MLLSHDEISDLLDAEVIEYSEPELINASSLDIRLGTTILVERPKHCQSLPAADHIELNRIVLRDRDALNMVAHDLKKDGPFILYPGEFILAHSHEAFNLPNDISAEYMLKSSMGRIALDHMKAGWCDAGWHDSVLTLELKNHTRYHEIVLHHLDKIGQIKFFRHRPVRDEHSYATRGRYNGDRSVSGAKISPADLRKVLVVNEGEEDNGNT